MKSTFIPKNNDDVWNMALEEFCAEEYDSPCEIPDHILQERLCELREKYNIKADYAF